MGSEGFNEKFDVKEMSKEEPRAIKEFREFAPAIRANSPEISNALETLTNDDWVNFDSWGLGTLGMNYKSMQYIEASEVPSIVQGIENFRDEKDIEKRKKIAREVAQKI